MMKRLYISLILLVVAVVLHAQNIPSGYYNGITNQTGTTLKAALHNIIKNDDHTTYSGLWTAYYQTDKRGTNKVWDIYSDNPGGQLPYEYVLGDNQCGGYNGEGSCYNREHLWAQSWTNNDSNEKTDLHHVYPTDGYVNSQRSNYAFGEVGTASWTSLNGGKLGACKTSGYTGTVFEPIDEYKGDIARALMYVSVRYYTEDSGWGSSTMTNKSEILPWAVTMLLRWHAEDPVSDKEIARNEAVYGIQGNRNPFVDHPEYAAAIWAPNSSYQITASVSPSNAGTVSGAGSYAAGHTCTLTATPNAGYTFINWTKNSTVVSTNATYSFTVAENAAYQANFGTGTYQIAVAAGSGGSAYIGDSPSSTPVMESIDFSAQGYSNEQSITSATIDDNVSVTFNQGTNTSNAPKYFNTGTAIRCYAGNNFVVNAGTYNITSITLTFGSGDNSNEITTNVGSFNGSSWSGEATSVTFTIGGTKNHRRIRAISVTYSGGTPATQADLAVGSEVTVTASPNSGYSFVDWTKNNTHVSSDISYTFTVTEAANLQANFINNAVSSSQTIASLTLNGKVTVWSGKTLTVTGTITQPEGSSLVLNNTGQLVHATPGISAKVKKNVTKWATSPVAGWHAISTPVNNVTFANVTNLTPTGSYNVYRLNESTMTWENCLDDHNVFDWFDNGRGYLYRKGNNTAIEFNGTLNVGNVIYPLTYTSSTTKGFHLIGNPYPHNIYKGADAAIPNTYLEDGFYTLTSAGGWSAGTDHTMAIAPCQAILVQAKSSVNNDTLTITKTTSTGTAKDNYDNIMFVVSNNDYEDVAYAVFKEGHGLNKIEHRNEAIQKLYIEHNGEDFAIADIGEDAQTFNLRFHAATTARYTMKIKASGDFSCLHLIDRITGEDVDLLVEDEYSFIGTPSDNESRFIVKFRCSSTSNVDEDIFAYQSGNEIVVEGDGELQIFDLMGRIVMQRCVKGIETITQPSNGVYIFKLNAKTQKIVVK